jgi:membrane protein DedA with SNARE-associated domain
MVTFGQSIDHLLATYGYFAVFAIVGLESFGIPSPGETILITASIYAGATHRLQIELVIAAAVAGAVLGDNCGYAVGHWGGYRLLVRYGRYARLDEGSIKLVRLLFLRHGGKLVYFGRFVSVLRTYAALFAGTTRMPWWRFLLFNAAGGITWATFWGLAAYLAGRQIDKLLGPVGLVLAVLGALVLIAAIVLVRSNEARLKEEAERAFPGPLRGTE